MEKVWIAETNGNWISQHSTRISMHPWFLHTWVISLVSVYTIIVFYYRSNKQAYWLDFLWIVFSTTCHLVIVIAPYIFWQWKGYQAFCVASEPEIQPGWCHNKIPSLYGYVQDKYWNVGFLKYWQLKQIPNFALALPALLLWSRDASAYFRELFAAAESCWIKVQDQGSKHKELLSLHFIRSFAITFCESDELTLENNYRPGPSSQKSPPPKMRLFGLYIQWSILAFMSIFVINVQVATRLFSSSCPCFYWALGHYYITSESYQENNRIDWKNNVFRYLLLYNLLGVILHPNFLPWTWYTHVIANNMMVGSRRQMTVSLVQNVTISSNFLGGRKHLSFPLC